DCNRLARAAGFAVANKPGITAYNPLFIFSGVGLGKTHLLQAIGNQIKELFPRKAVLYVSSERFINQFVEAVRKGTVNDFMTFYQMIDVLLVDDIQFLSGKEKTQENFFHVFNHLRQSGKQIVLASDRPPHEIEGMEERLLSRFKWGLNASLQMPEYGTRKQILQTKMYQNGIELPDEVVDYIAHNITSNIRELEGALISLLAQSSLNRQEVDIELTRSMLKNFVETVSREITIESIQQIVSEHLGVEIDLMKAKTRKRDIVQARQIAMFFAKELTRHSLKSIGLHFGGRDHSTVIHALQTVNDLITTDKLFKQNVQDIRKRITLEVN
ncbi:MAG: chromosomal replication initiator protein DnaA, partial [Bacteroidota bacterium]